MYMWILFSVYTEFCSNNSIAVGGAVKYCCLTTGLSTTPVDSGGVIGAARPSSVFTYFPSYHCTYEKLLIRQSTQHLQSKHTVTRWSEPICITTFVCVYMLLCACNKYVNIYTSTPIQHLSPWMQSRNDLERKRAVLCFLDVITAYQTHSDTDEVHGVYVLYTTD